MDYARLGGGLNAIGTALRGGDGMAEVERAERKKAIGGLMDRMGIAGPKRDILASMPVNAATEALWGMANPQPAENVVINGQLVNRQTGQVVGDYNAQPIDMGGLFDFSPYAVGGATRPDSFSRMTPGMRNGLQGMLTTAEQEIGPGLQVYSGYRSPELQAELYAKAVEKYGSPEAARKWVAPPGNSKHNTGQAADLKWNGKRLDQAPKHVQDWVRNNAARFGLDVPMEWEPWQVEEAGARGQKPSPTAKIDAQIDRATQILMSGKGTPQQRDGLKQHIENLELRRKGMGGEAVPASIQALEYRAKAAGLKPGTPEYSQFMLEGGRTGGLLVETGPDGQIRVAQGSAASNPKFNEVESKTNVYYTRAKGALEVLEPRAHELTSATSRAVEGDPTGVIRGAVQSDEFQIAKNAGDEYLQAILRKDTGAAITESEQYLYGRTYLPQPGDSDAVLQAKSDARKRALKALESGMSAAQMLAAERALGEVDVPETAEIAEEPAQQITFESFSAQASQDPEVQQALQGGLTLEQIWQYHPDNPEAQ